MAALHQAGNAPQMHTVCGVKPGCVRWRRAASIAMCVAVTATCAPSADAEPAVDAAPSDAAPPTDGKVQSGAPATVTTPDGWTLALGAKDESQVPVPPLTTAVSSREYLASGTFVASLVGPEDPRGLLEVGYEIGCGIDMSTSNGVTMTGGAGVTPSVGISGPLGALPSAILPVISTPVNGIVTVGLKPGFVVVVPVDKKDFKGTSARVTVRDIHIKVDNCVGASTLRSYAVLTSSAENDDDVVAYYGVAKVF